MFHGFDVTNIGVRTFPNEYDHLRKEQRPNRTMIGFKSGRVWPVEHRTNETVPLRISRQNAASDAPF